MMNKKRIFSALTFVLYATASHLAFAESPVSRLHIDAYRCASFTEPLQKVYVNLGGHRGFVQLEIPMRKAQVPISILKQCLLQNGLMSQEEFAAYGKAIAACRRAHQQKKAEFSRGDIMKTSTSQAFNYDHCLRDNLLD